MSAFANRVAVVTGAASGIGLAIATLLAARGARVVMADVADSTDAAAALSAAGGLATPALVDVTDRLQVEQCFAAAVARFGSVDIVVNSAGTTVGALVTEQPIGEFQKVIAVNLLGSFLVGQSAARHMMRKGGVILNMASVAALRGFPTRAAYCASKAGVWNLTQVMAVELAAHGIRVNAIAPGPVDTPLSRATHGDGIRAAWHAVLPQGRYSEDREVAEAALYLVSDEASFVTGHLLCVDGGFQATGFTAQALAKATADLPRPA